jgi:hypothetical protein
MEDAMKLSVVLLALVFAGVTFAGQPSSRPESKQEKKTATSQAKETKWQGHILRINKDDSTMDIRGGVTTRDNDQKKIAYDSSTKWTKLGKPAEESEFKDGSRVIAVGQVDEKGVLHATRIDLRLPD